MTTDQFMQELLPGEVVDAASNPDLANALGALAMGEEKPLRIDSPPDGTVTLPGGYLGPDGLKCRATVRELCGADEEELAKPGIARDFAKSLDILLTRCVESIGDDPATRAMLDDLLIGDRDMLVQAIRVATYGDTMDLSVTCLHCNAEFEIEYSFADDVPVSTMKDKQIVLDGGETITLDPGSHVYTLPLRRGNVAEVQLVTGSIQRAVYTTENADRSSAELNTMLLTKCVRTVNAQHVNVDLIRRMSSADRKCILKFLGEAQPGPQWGEVKQTCPRCDKEFPLVIDVPTMFRGGQ